MKHFCHWQHSGELLEWVQYMLLLVLCLIRSQTPACSSGAVVVPFRVTVWIVGVASPALRSQSCVLGSVPTLGLDVARFLNRYQVKTKQLLNMSHCY